MSDANSSDNIVPDRSKPVPKPKKETNKKPEVAPTTLITQVTTEQETEEILEHNIFNYTRDISTSKPYHEDGDPAMYSKENLQKRNNLSKDKDVIKELDEFIALYKFNKDVLDFQNYKRVHEIVALTLRPEIQQDELDFLVQCDYEHDTQEGPLTRERLRKQLFEMVDIWTTGVEKKEYIMFIKLLKVKVSRTLLTKK